MEKKQRKKGVISISTMQHIGCREEQQDSCAVFKKVDKEMQEKSFWQLLQMAWVVLQTVMKSVVWLWNQQDIIL